MNALLTLLRLRVRVLLRPKVSKRGGTGGRRNTAMLVRIAILGVVGIGLSISLGNLLGLVVSGPLGRLLLTPLLTWVSSAASLLLFLASVPVVLAAFTYGSDLSLLLLTPLPPRLILGEKFLSLYGGLDVLLLAIGAIILASIGTAIGLGLAYYLVAVLALLLLAVPPVSLAVLLTVAVLRWVPPARARTITAVLGALFGVIVYLGIQLLNVRGAARSGSVQQLFSSADQSWWANLPSAWPGRALAAAGLGQTGTALGYLAAEIALAALLAGLAILLSAHLFATGWATYQEVGRRAPATVAADAVPPSLGQPAGAEIRPAGGRAPLATAMHAASVAVPAIGGEGPRGVWWTLVRKEWTTLRRDTQVWSRLIYPLFVMGFAIYQAVQRNSTGAMQSVRAGTSLITIGFLIYFLLILLALPVINREGRSLYLLALAPVSAREILLAKWFFCAAPIVILAEVVLIGGAALLHIAAGTALLVAAAFGMLVVASAGALLLVSLIWPRLDWDNPRRQVSGTASLVGAIGALVLVGGTVTLVVFSQIWQASLPLASLAAIVGLFAVLALIVVAVLVAAPPRLAALLSPA